MQSNNFSNVQLSGMPAYQGSLTAVGEILTRDGYLMTTAEVETLVLAMLGAYAYRFGQP